ncbi:MAG: NADH-ubiquinone oxidoreductase-F iron-sulfur binding region domain-containing protein [Ilumatobacteraceae bacterium]
MVEELRGGTASGRPIRAVQVGGPLGSYLPADALDVPLDYEALGAIGAMLGHGEWSCSTTPSTCSHKPASRWSSVRRSPAANAPVPHRFDSRGGTPRSDRRRRRPGPELALLDELCETMAAASLCAMGGLTPMPVRSAFRHFAEDFQRTGGVVR